MTLARVAVTALAALLLGANGAVVSQSGLLLVSSANPKIALRIEQDFVALAPVKVSLESTDVDRRVFVDSDVTHRVKHLIVVQFEHVRAGVAFKFIYPPEPPFVFGADTYRLGTYVHDVKDPAREAGATRAALEKQGYALPRLFRTVRLARVADSDGTNEIIVFYNEDADADYPPGPLAAADEDGDIALKGTKADTLLARMSSALSVVPPT
jgi:hypothetical protein